MTAGAIAVAKVGAQIGTIGQPVGVLPTSGPGFLAGALAARPQK